MEDDDNLTIDEPIGSDSNFESTNMDNSDSNFEPTDMDNSDSNFEPTDIDEDPEEDEIEFSELEEDKGITFVQILSLIALGIVSFFIFLVLFFPFKELAHYFITQNTAPSGIYVDFKDLSVRKQIIHTLTVNTPDNLDLKIEEVETTASIWDLKNDIFSGLLTLRSFHLDAGNFEMKAGSISLEGKAGDISKGLSGINGNIKLQLSNGNIIKTPDFPVLGPLDKAVISSFHSDLIARNGNITFQNGLLKSNIASIKFKGSVRILNPIGNSVLNVEICPTLTKSFSNERPDIAGMLKMLNDMNKQNCVTLKGTFSRPSIDMPSFVPPQSNEEETSIETGNEPLQKEEQLSKPEQNQPKQEEETKQENQPKQEEEPKQP